MARKVVRSGNIAEARILIIYTGGTIGMVQDQKAMTLKPFNFNRIISEIPELRKFNLEIDAISFRPVIDSSNMTPEKWEQLAQMIHDHYDLYDGFVVLHGTDTLAYTASALSYMFEGDKFINDTILHSQGYFFVSFGLFAKKVNIVECLSARCDYGFM